MRKIHALAGLAIMLCIVSGCSSSSGGGTSAGVFEFTGSMENYVVPAGVTSLHIVALGASGGDTETEDAVAIMTGGFGASVDTVVSVTPGDTLSIVIGEQPPLQVAGLDGCGGSGGGGTFVVLDPAATPLAVAGGGGGSSGYDEVDGLDASTTGDGVDSDSYVGGTGGAGGGSDYAGGGGGLTGDGEDGSGGSGGMAFVNGASGGARDDDRDCGTLAKGGFGGGGGGEYDDAGGGGGYSGGAGASDSGGGGGGSFAAGVGTITIRTSHGHGSVLIEPM